MGHGNLWTSRNICVIHDAIGDTVAAGHEWVGQAYLPLPASISPNPSNLSFEFVTKPAGADGAYFDNILVTKIGSAAATAIELYFTQVALKKGETRNLKVSASSEGCVMGKVTGPSGDKDIAGVSDQGEITALLSSVVIISAKAGTLTAFCKVTVEDDGGNNTVTIITIAAGDVF